MTEVSLSYISLHGKNGKELLHTAWICEVTGGEQSIIPNPFPARHSQTS